MAELQLQGVTGLLYIDLMEDRADKRAAPAVAGLKYPVIRSAPSRFDVFLSSLPELVADAGEVVRRANQLLSDDQPECRLRRAGRHRRPPRAACRRPRAT